MNVVQREKHNNLKSKPKNELVRRDASTGIRGATLLPSFTHGSKSRTSVNPRTINNGPRYQFSEPSTLKISSMGPPPPLLGPPRSTKRRYNQSSSTRAESSSSASRAPAPRVLASDSAAGETSQDFATPKNRPSALRYISSSSRGGHSGARSARSTSTSIVEASVILAISEGRGLARGEIGMAAVDLRQPHLVLCQFSDTLLYTHTLTKINYFNPVEIIVPHTFCEGVQPNQLYQLIRDQFPMIHLTTVQRRHFNDAAGLQQIQSLCAPQYSAVYLQVLHKFYAVTAAAAVLKYVEYIQCIVFARESLKIEYHSSENTMIIDVGTATQLELVQPLVPSAGPTCCLLGVLGPTYTIGGIRALRAAILQPSCNKEFIESRLDAVQDLIENDSGLMTSLQDVVKKLADVDKILFLCVESPNQNMDKMGEAQLNQTLLLKTTMDVVPKLIEALEGANSGKLKSIKMDFENPHYNEIAERIKLIIQEDTHLEKGAMGSLQRCFAVKPNINGLLDVARRTYSELIDDIQKIVEQLSESYDLPLRLNQNAMKGFHIVMPIAPKNRRHFNVDDLPPIFIQVNFTGANVTMTTEELVVLDHQAKESLNEIQKMSNIVISGLLKDLRPFMSSLYKLCENIAELDILLALAHTSTIGSYIRPEFSNYLEIRNSIHPLLDYNSQVMPVPNDIVFSERPLKKLATRASETLGSNSNQRRPLHPNKINNNSSTGRESLNQVFASPELNFTIITGPNMGGKSIYIKQVAMLQIMAQLGCFLPATTAVLRLSDRMFSRIGFNDSVELNASTYVVEMKEMQHILKGLTKSSLVIIDELCRGTCTEEGTSIAWAICEELLMSEAFTFFTTHFMYLTRLQDLYFNVVNRHTVVTEDEIANTQNFHKRLVYQHKVELGTTKIDHYGLALASKTNLPEDTVKLARELAELIALQRKPQEIKSPIRNDEETLYKLNAEVRQESRKYGNSDEKIKAIIRKFKEEHPQLIERLKVENSRNNNSARDSSVTSAKESSNGNSVSIGNNPTSIYKTPPKISKPVVFNNSTDINQIENSFDGVRNFYRTGNTNASKSFNGTRVEDSSKSESSGQPPNQIQPVAVYSASDEDYNENKTSNTNETYATVKSSSDMFTTLMNVENDSRESGNLTQEVDIEKSRNANENSRSSNESNDSSHNHMHSSHKHNNAENSSGIYDINEIDESESDLAEALTQVIEDGSMGSSSRETSDMSVDEDLMKETVAEIHEELQRSASVSIENLTLTPPPGFRD